MRPSAAAALLTVVAAVAIPLEGRQTPNRPNDILDAARKAVGGKSRLAAVSAFRLEGKSESLNQFYGQSPAARQQFLQNALRIEALPPSHYARLTTRADSPIVRQRGFSGETLLNFTRLPGGKEDSWTGPDAMRSVRAEFARLMILVLLRTDTPLAVQATGGSGSSVAFTGHDEFKASLEMDEVSGQPKSLRFSVRMVNGGEIREYVTTIDERRVVDGISVPVRLTTTASGKTFERISLDLVDLRAQLTPSDFKESR